MTDQPLTKISHRMPNAVLARFNATDGALALIAETSTAEQCLRNMVGAGLYPDAAQFLAHALPSREAVWWACVTARHIGEQPLDQSDERTLTAAEFWVRKPTDFHGRVAMHAAQQAGLHKAASRIGAAAYMDRNPSNPLGTLPPSPPGALTGSMVGSAVIMLALIPDADAADEKYRKALTFGLRIAAHLPAQGIVTLSGERAD